MDSKSPARKPDQPLRKGWTTGACAAAAAAAAYRVMQGEAPSESIKIRLPKGQTPSFPLYSCARTKAGAHASVIKDAGDDPDVTHGAEVICDLAPRAPGEGIAFYAGVGVGTVTLPGLPVPVGEPAINPGPRGMITDALQAVAEELDGDIDLAVTISIPTGAALAKKTMNPRLGIQGGLSILGTTGIVIPYSCASWINAIHRGVDVARKINLHHLIAATGSTSEAAAMRDHADLPEQAFIDMGDFAGGLLKYLRRNPVERLTLAGGAAKLGKLSQGHLDLHSARSRLDMTRLAALARHMGADEAVSDAIANANTAMQAMQIAKDTGLPLADAMARGARETARAALAGAADVDILIYDRSGQLIGKA